MPDYKITEAIVDVLNGHRSVINSSPVFSEAEQNQNGSHDMIMQELLKPWNGRVTTGDTMEIFQKLPDPDTALCFFRWVIKQPGYIPNIYVYTKLLDIMGKAKKIDSMEWILQSMRQNGYSPNAVTYSCLIHAYSQAGRLQDAIRISAEMKQRGLQFPLPTYGTLMILFAKSGHYGNLTKLYDETEAAGLPLPVTVLGTCLRTLGESGRFLHLIKFFDRIKQSKNGMPPVSLWNNMIQAFAKKGKVSEAMAVFQEMTDSEVEPNIVTWTTLINICGKCGRPLEAELLFEKMISSGMQPDLVAWNVMIHLQAGDSGRASLLFDKMTSAGVEPTVVTYNSLLNAFLKAKDYARAKETFSRMKQSGIEPSAPTYLMLLNGFSDCADRTWSLQLMELMDGCGFSGHESVKLILDSCEDDIGLRSKVKALFHAMETELDDYKRSMTNFLMNILTKKNYHGSAEKVWQEVRSMECWAHALPGKGRGIRSNMWVLDFHQMSPSAAVVVIKSELNLLWRMAMIQSRSQFPEKIVIVLGAGLKRGADCRVKQSVVEFLESVKSPFREDVGNAGVVSASGVSVKEWLVDTQFK